MAPPLPLLALLLGPGLASHLVKRSLQADPLAVCNDGSPAGYYYSEDNLEATRLMIDLQGGGLCTNLASCLRRCKQNNQLCTEDMADYHDKPKTMWNNDPEENPAFHDYAKVYVHYCSSDFWTGTMDASEETGGLIFHGRHIVEAVVDDIINHAPNLHNLEQVVLMGTSAGANGVYYNCDMVADKFNEVLPSLDVRCVADAGDFYPPYLSNSEDCNMLAEMSGVFSFWGAKLDSSCFAGTWTGESNKLECISYMTSYKDVTTPLMVVNHFMDTVVHGPCTPPIDEDPVFWATWEEEVLVMAEQYIVDKPDNGMFLSNCRFHVSVNQEFAWSAMPVALVTDPEVSVIYKELLTSWLTGGGPHQAMDKPLVTNPECPYA